MAGLALIIAAPGAAARPGDPDPTFGSGGVVVDTARPEAAGIALDHGRILAVGSALSRGCSTVSLARRLSDGSPDRSFASGGSATPALRSCEEEYDYSAGASSVVVAPDGRILTAGRISEGQSGRNSGGLLTAHLPDGRLDPAFGGRGWVRAGFHEGTISDLARLPDGRLVAGGDEYSLRTSPQIGRYLPDGSPDASFAGDGSIDYGWGGYRGMVAALVPVGGDGALVAVGDADRRDGPRAITLVQLAADGSFDPAFGTDGRTRIELPGVDPQAAAAVRTPDGGYVVAGTTSPAGSAGTGARWLLIKVDPHGALDRSFGSDGRVDGPPGAPKAMEVDATGRLVLAGAVGGQAVVARHLPDGTVDRSFGLNGLAPLGMAVANDLLVQPDGRIVAGGSVGGRPRAMALARLLGDEALRGRAESRSTHEDGVSIRIVSPRVTGRGVLVRVTYARGTEGRVRARLWTRRKTVLLGQRNVATLPGTTGRRFRVPLNRRAKRMFRGGRVLKIRATVRVTGLPERR